MGNYIAKRIEPLTQEKKEWVFTTKLLDDLFLFLF